MPTVAELAEIEARSPQRRAVSAREQIFTGTISASYRERALMSPREQEMLQTRSSFYAVAPGASLRFPLRRRDPPASELNGPLGVRPWPTEWPKTIGDKATHVRSPRSLAPWRCEAMPRWWSEREPPAGKRPELTPEQVAEVNGVVGQLRATLAKNLNRIIDTFREFDVDKSNAVDKKEWRKACVRLGVSARESALNNTFDVFDIDGSGTLDYKEVNRSLRRKMQDPSHRDQSIKWVGLQHNDPEVVAFHENLKARQLKALAAEPHEPVAPFPPPGPRPSTVAETPKRATRFSASMTDATTEASTMSPRLKMAKDVNGRAVFALPPSLSPRQLEEIFERTNAALVSKGIHVEQHRTRKGRVLVSPRA